jgi:hypothetical protein
MDTFFTSEGLWFTEYNAETPAAPAYCDALSDVFLGLPVMQRFEREHDIWPLPGRHHVLAALLDAYRQWGGRERPSIAILDWRETQRASSCCFKPTASKAMTASSPTARLRIPQWAAADGVTPINLIYKRADQRAGGPGRADSWCARCASAACMVNRSAASCFIKKPTAAVLSDGQSGPVQRRRSGAIDCLFPGRDRRAQDAVRGHAVICCLHCRPPG